MKRLLAAAALLVVVLAAASAYAWRTYHQFLAAPLAVAGDGAVVTVEPGMSGSGVVARLAEQNLTEPGWRWRLLLRLEPAILQAGEYRVEPGMTPAQLLRKLARGDVIRYRFTIVEGWTVSQLFAALAGDEVLRATLAEAAPGELVADHANPEGWFLPETYTFVRGDSDRDLLKWAHDAMRQALAEAWERRVPGHPAATPYDLLILASIIEKETARDDERNRIAGVFVRRLLNGMRLQTDPTVIYGLGEAYDGDIRKRDLEADTPYNTYTRSGLPPTPIALPGRASLEAAAQPAPGDELYFVADGSGGHTFSATLDEHNQAVDRMLGRTP